MVNVHGSSRLGNDVSVPNLHFCHNFGAPEEGVRYGVCQRPLRELKRLQFAKVSRTNVQRAAGPHCSEGSRACQTNKELQFWGQD